MKIEKLSKDKKSEFMRAVIDITQTLDPKLRTQQEIAEYVAFRVLTLIDGESTIAGPYALRPIDEHGNEGIDIAGDLHELFCAMMKEE
jgi:hypothetical protein